MGPLQLSYLFFANPPPLSQVACQLFCMTQQGVVSICHHSFFPNVNNGATTIKLCNSLLQISGIHCSSVVTPHCHSGRLVVYSWHSKQCSGAAICMLIVLHCFMAMWQHTWAEVQCWMMHQCCCSRTAAMPCMMHRLIGFCWHQCSWFLAMLHHRLMPKIFKMMTVQYSKVHSWHHFLSLIVLVVLISHSQHIFLSRILF